MFRRTFQSKATFIAFSTASAPPSTKKTCLDQSGRARPEKASTNSAICVVYMSELAGLLMALRPR